MFKRLGYSEVLVIIGLVLMGASGAEINHRSFEKLQQSLMAASSDETTMVFREGKDFLSAPGTVIFVSRAEGKQRLVKLARAGEAELSMLFLPRWEAWITETNERQTDKLRLDSRYVMAALISEPEVELWHTHNDVRDSTDTFKGQSLSRQWTMPWIDDLLQLYDYSREVPGANIRCCIANVYGVTSYWNDKPDWSAPLYIRFALRTEAVEINREVAKIKIEDLKIFAAHHQGIIQLRFEPMR